MILEKTTALPRPACVSAACVKGHHRRCFVLRCGCKCHGSGH
jgi:hypothetical protein